MKYFLFVMIGFFALSGSVNAQVQLPQFSISNIPTIELDKGTEIDYGAAFTDIQNPMMRDTLRLQYQINLLERLIRRQTEIQRIAESYEEIGVPFNQPAPPETACMQLPVNVLCMAFYPESAKYKDLIEERQEEFERDQKRQMDVMMQQVLSSPSSDVLDNLPMAQMVQQSITVSPDRQYAWSDIRCLAGKCSALLINRDDSNARFRIRQGEDLPDDGGTVTKISLSGVKARFEKETYELLPEAVAGGQRVDPRPDTSGIADLLSDNLGDEANNSPAVQAQADAAITPQVLTDSNTPSPMLGVTGLF